MRPIYSRSTMRLSLLVRGALILSGLAALFLASNALPVKVGQIDLAQIVSNLGAFLATSVVVQWIFDDKMRRELMEDIAIFTIGNQNVTTSGICDFQTDTRKISYNDMLARSKDVTIGLHYSPRIIEDNYDLLELRARKQGCTTVILVCDLKEALDFLRHVRKEEDHILSNLKKIEFMINSINDGAKSPIRLLRHNTVLRYSFVKSDSICWIKFYRNCAGYAKTPGICVSEGSPLYAFADDDISGMIKEATTW